MSKILLSAQEFDKLIGDDKELRVKITTSVANQIVEKFIKTVVNDHMAEITKQRINEEINLFCTGNKYYSNTAMTDRFRVIIERLVQNRLNDFTREIVDKTISESKVVERLNELLETASNKIANTLLEENISKRIDMLADKKIKERLGIN